MATSPKKFKVNVQIDASLVLSNETASRALIVDGSGNVSSSSVTDTELGYLSGVTSAIQTQLGAKLDDFASTSDNRLVRTDGTAGDALQDSGITIDDSDNMTGVNDLTVGGNLTVNGTTTTINSSTLDVTDANITVNNGGNQASADTQDAGITVEMSDATDATLGYDSTLASKFAIGEVGATAEVASVSHTQTFTNKTIVVASNTITTAASGNLTSTELNAALAELQSDIDTRQSDVITTQGDLVVGDVGGSASRLALGTNGQVLQSNGTTATWSTLSTADEQVKVSANDTTAKYLEDAIVVAHGTNTTNPLETSTLNDAGDEDFQIQFDESKVVHDNLSGFVANEHIDHSSVNINTAADSGLTGGGDITTSRSLAVNIAGTTAETSADDADSILIHDSSAGALREMTRANFLSGLAQASNGDIADTQFAGAQSAAGASVTGLAFTNANTRSFRAQVAVVIDATANLYEVFTLEGIQKGASWDMSVSSTGDDTLVSFDISSAGQVTYSSSTYAGFVSMKMKFRAETLDLEV